MGGERAFACHTLGEDDEGGGGEAPLNRHICVYSPRNEIPFAWLGFPTDFEGNEGSA